MRRLVRFFSPPPAGRPPVAAAQVQPHRAEYALRLGAAVNAPRIGTAVQDLSLDCGGWHLKRDINTEIALTTSWKISLASKLDGEERAAATPCASHRADPERQRARDHGPRAAPGGELRAEIVSPDGPPNSSSCRRPP